MYTHDLEQIATRAIIGYQSKSPCAEALIPMIRAFQRKAQDAVKKGSKEFFAIMVMNVAKRVAENANWKEKLTDEDVSSIQEIFDVLEKLLEESITFDSEYTQRFATQANNFHNKVNCLQEILIKNQLLNPRIFHSYKHLSLIVARIINEWDDLCSRGFSLQDTFYPFWKAVEYSQKTEEPLSEEDKYNLFINLLDGKAKLVPVFQRHVVGVEIIPSDDEDEFVFDDSRITTNCFISEAHKLKPKLAKSELQVL